MAVVLAAVASQAAPGAGVCPVDGVARIERDVDERWVRALAATRSDDVACRVKGQLAAGLLDRHGHSACRTLEWSASLRSGAADAEVLAMESVYAWRCGRPREARFLAKAAIDADPGASMAWDVLGRALESEWRPESAERAFAQAHRLDPDRVETLWELSGLVPSPSEREELLERYLELAPRRGESSERISSARQTLDLLRILDGRPLWILERSEIPGTIDLDPIVKRAGHVAGWTIELPVSERRSVRALVDTGASGLHLAKNTARRIELEPLQEGELFGGGGTGRHRVRRAIVPHISVGPLHFKDALGVVAEGSLSGRGMYQAILGANVFLGLELAFEPRESRLLIERALPPHETASAPAARLEERCDGRGVPIYAIGGQLLVPIVIDPGRDGGRGEGLALFDTGAASTLFGLELMQELSAVQRGSVSRLRGYGGTIGVAGHVAVAEVSLDRLVRRLRDVPVVDLSARARLTQTNVVALLGWDFFRLDAFALDLAEGCLEFRAAAQPSARSRRRRAAE